MEKEYLSGSVEEYLKDLSLRKAAPGGGSAAALTGALGAALNLMVINYSMKGIDDEALSRGLVEAGKRQEESLGHLSSLIDEDCEAFQKLLYALRAGRDAQKEYIGAATVPMKTCRECHVSLTITSHLIENAAGNLLSDVACASGILAAAFYAAQVNVKINLGQIKDPTFIENAEEMLKSMSRDVEIAERGIKMRYAEIMSREKKDGNND